MEAFMPLRQQAMRGSCTCRAAQAHWQSFGGWAQSFAAPGHVAQVAGLGLDHDWHGSKAAQLPLHGPSLGVLPAQAGVESSLIGEPLQGGK